jgi:hypothetical protein
VQHDGGLLEHVRECGGLCASWPRWSPGATRSRGGDGGGGVLTITTVPPAALGRLRLSLSSPQGTDFVLSHEHVLNDEIWFSS